MGLDARGLGLVALGYVGHEGPHVEKGLDVVRKGTVGNAGLFGVRARTSELFLV